jgi:hypothetical protein
MPIVIPSEEIKNRDHFGYLCRHRGLTFEAMEVGVDQAFFAKQFMTEWGGNLIHLVDPYLPYEEMAGDRTADMMVAILAMMPWHGKFKFYRLGSVEAAKHLPRWIRPQFIYIDANHGYDQVRMDMDCWWRRLPEDGILAGHDYDEDHPGVVQAVNEFSDRHEVTVRLTFDDAPAPVSWYIYKTEPSDFRMLIE